MAGWGLAWMGVLWLLLLVLAVVLLVWFLVPGRSRNRQTGNGYGAPGPFQQPPLSPPREPTPAELLDCRLVRGEIDVDTYRALRAELARSTPTGPPKDAPGPG